MSLTLVNLTMSVNEGIQATYYQSITILLGYQLTGMQFYYFFKKGEKLKDNNLFKIFYNITRNHNISF